MDINLDDLSSTEVYYTMTETLVPRPIAWVLSENLSGSYNLAPFSYFTAVCSNPPLIMISVGKKPDGSPKDTGVVSTVNCRSQRVEKRAYARHTSAGLAVDNSSECNTADGRFSIRPKGAIQTAQYCVAAT